MRPTVRWKRLRNRLDLRQSKAAQIFAQTRGQELKARLAADRFRSRRAGAPPYLVSFLLQPMDGPDRIAHTARALCRVCKADPRWRLSRTDTHKPDRHSLMFELSRPSASTPRTFDARSTPRRTARITAISIAEVALRGEPDPETGMVMTGSRSVSTTPWRTIRGRSIIVFSTKCPTSATTMENLAAWIWRRLAPICPGLCRVGFRAKATARLRLCRTGRRRFALTAAQLQRSAQCARMEDRMSQFGKSPRPRRRNRRKIEKKRDMDGIISACRSYALARSETYFDKCMEKIGFVPNVLLNMRTTQKLDAFTAFYNDL